MTDSVNEERDIDQLTSALGLAGPADAPPLHKIKRVLVVKFRHLGDVLLTSAVLNVLRRHLPEAQIDALIYADTIAMLDGHPALHTIHTIDKKWKKLGPIGRLSREWDVLRRIRAQGYDLVINLTEGDRGAVAALASRARWRVGLNDPRNNSKPLQRLAYTHLYRTEDGSRHMVEQNLDALRRIGIRIPLFTEPLTFSLDDGDRERARDKLKRAGLDGGDYVVCHPTSRWLFKCLPVDTVAALIDHLAERDFRVVLTGAPDKRERAMADEIIERSSVGVMDLSGKLELKELGVVIDGSRLFVGADSVPMHMAAALHTPVVAWFGPSFDVVWHPWMVHHRLVTEDVSCRPCGIDGCGSGKRSECLVQMPWEQIAEAIDTLLDETS